MQNHDVSQSTGNLRISREVIATIARYAALEIEGVVSMASFATNLKGWLLKKQSARPISIELNDDVAVICLHINVRSGVNIPKVSENVQRAVKEAVQNMTGIVVSRVNIVIAGIVFDEPLREQPEE
ncbi:Asp23/Gls24 family envelope stress response protein [Marasmitruncus massiliensis]|uniref:Asp23/Gls24 family envelope stress response protein n=1 Tax=Marasmitruncus massiliensis TaxID=1944642 RepID=UPI000C7CDF86|nr:Asp23/Gls24 family envelope stress response protein [Marasmitruncus massiliensis]